MSRVKDKKKRLKSLADNRSKMDKAYEVDQSNIRDKLDEHEENHESKKLRNKKRKNKQTAETEIVKTGNVTEDGFGKQDGGANEVQEHERSKPKKKRSRKEKKARLDKVDTEAEDNFEQGNDDENIQTTLSGTQSEIETSEGLNNTDSGSSLKTCNSKKGHKKKKTRTSSKGEENLLHKRDAEEDKVYEISSGDEDSSKGMKKWIMEYRQRRPGLNVLQEKIDEFITANEAREEQERREREAHAAEDGWTVVSHHKGRKKTTDLETGVAVGSVAQAAVLEKMAKKKSKGVGLDFYRFQKRESHKNDILMLQNKFEQDKKKIQQLRAARKFRPY